MSRVPQEILEYNRLEGVGLTRELFQIMVPLVWPTVVTTFVIGMTSVLTVYLQPYFLMDSASTAPFRTCTISLLIFNGYATPANGPYLSAFGLTCTAIFVPFILLGRFILNQFFNGSELLMDAYKEKNKIKKTKAEKTGVMDLFLQFSLSTR